MYLNHFLHVLLYNHQGGYYMKVKKLIIVTLLLALTLNINLKSIDELRVKGQPDDHIIDIF